MAIQDMDTTMADTDDYSNPIQDEDNPASEDRKNIWNHIFGEEGEEDHIRKRNCFFQERHSKIRTKKSAAR